MLRLRTAYLQTLHTSVVGSEMSRRDGRIGDQVEQT